MSAVAELGIMGANLMMQAVMSAAETNQDITKNACYKVVLLIFISLVYRALAVRLFYTAQLAFILPRVSCP